MKSNTERLAFLLAASGFSEEMIYDSLKGLEVLGARALLRRVLSIRRNVINRSREVFLEEGVADEALANQRWEQWAEQIALLLLVEAHLNPSTAAERLLGSLSSELVGAKQLPQLRKKEGFRSWLRRLAKSVPYSVLLHLATKIRNDIVHSAPSDWPLRDRDR